MKLWYFGHACLGVESEGVRVLMDPYEPFAFQGRLAFHPVPGTWNLVLVSHDHADHGHVSESFGTPTVARSSGVFQGMDVLMWTRRHGTAKGRVDAETRVYRFALEGLTLGHLGDLGEVPDPELAKALRGLDILFLPVGGFFTIDAHQAWETVSMLRPRIVVPIHYRTASTGLEIEPVEPFLERSPLALRRFPTGETSVSMDLLPEVGEVWVLPPLLASRG